MARKYTDVYEKNHKDFEIDGIEYEDDASETPDPIEFKYEAPAISVDTAGRYSKHSIIGGSTVRQKIGEEPIQVTVKGVVKESTARKLDSLRDARFGTIYSDRLPDSSLQVHFASTSTSPLEDSGAVAITDEDEPEFLYTFNLSCVEVFTGIESEEQ